MGCRLTHIPSPCTIFQPLIDGHQNMADSLQYYHRNSATEFMGLVYGVYGGRSDGFQPGNWLLFWLAAP